MESPVLRFWTDRLYSNDPNKAAEAFKIFSSACSEPLHYLPSDQLPKDSQVIKFAAFFCFNANRSGQALYKKDWELRIYGAETVRKITSAMLARLSNPSEAERALRVLNTFTMDVYDSKPIDWWLEHFSESKFAQILDGKPREEWISLPD